MSKEPRTGLYDRGNLLFIVLGGFFVANALIAEFIGVKIFQLESTLGWDVMNWTILGESVSMQYTAGVLLWPIIFVMTDVINEYYGMRGVRILSYLAVGLISYAFLMVYAAIALAPAEWWIGNYSDQGVSDMQQAFESVFGQGLFIIVGSLVAFLVGQLVDVSVFHKIKSWSGDQKVWLRATGSTLISQLIDSYVVLFIAFYLGPRIFSGGGEPWSLALFLAVAMNNYIYKVLMAVVLTPVLYVAHTVIDRFLGKDRAESMKRDAMKSN